MDDHICRGCLHDLGRLRLDALDGGLFAHAAFLHQPGFLDRFRG